MVPPAGDGALPPPPGKGRLGTCGLPACPSISAHPLSWYKCRRTRTPSCGKISTKTSCAYRDWPASARLGRRWRSIARACGPPSTRTCSSGRLMSSIWSRTVGGMPFVVLGEIRVCRARTGRSLNSIRGAGDVRFVCEFFKVPFEDVPDLVRERKVLLVRGVAFVPKRETKNSASRWRSMLGARTRPTRCSPVRSLPDVADCGPVSCLGVPGAGRDEQELEPVRRGETGRCRPEGPRKPAS